MSDKSVGLSLISDYFSYYKAIFARTLFISHAVVAVWRTTVIMGAAYWGLIFGVFLLLGEYFLTMWVRAGEEWPWISPSTLCYLASACSSLWLQKLENLGHVNSLNTTAITTLPSTSMKLDFSAPDWLLLTEQTMMVTIIIGRWLLPKGDLAHTELSSLLLLYLGLSADILDFSTIFSEEQVAADEIFCYMILLIWTASLCQFGLVLTTTSKSKQPENASLISIVCSSEIWQILVQVLLQDFPFLLVRVVALLNYKVFNYTIIFFVCKNTLVISLELYHMVAVCRQQKKKLERRRERIKRLKGKMTTAVKGVIHMASKKSGWPTGKNPWPQTKPNQTQQDQPEPDPQKENGNVSSVSSHKSVNPIVAFSIGKTVGGADHTKSILSGPISATVSSENKMDSKTQKGQLPPPPTSTTVKKTGATLTSPGLKSENARTGTPPLSHLYLSRASSTSSITSKSGHISTDTEVTRSVFDKVKDPPPASSTSSSTQKGGKVSTDTEVTQSVFDRVKDKF